MRSGLDPFSFLVISLAGWINERQQQVIEYLVEENRVLREQIGTRRMSTAFVWHPFILLPINRINLPRHSLPTMLTATLLALHDLASFTLHCGAGSHP